MNRGEEGHYDDRKTAHDGFTFENVRASYQPNPSKTRTKICPDLYEVCMLGL